MKSRRSVALLILIVATGTTLLIRKNGYEAVDTRRQADQESRPIHREIPAEDLAKRNHQQAALIHADWQKLQDWLQKSPSPSAEEIQQRLTGLRAKWSQMDPQVLSRALEEFLSSGDNLPLPLPFEVGPHGLLRGWPDLRIFLTDALAVADPEESARIALDSMKTTDSPAEYAVAIRSLVRGGPTDANDGELTACLETLLTRPDWQNSAAVAESLDLARFLGTPQAASILLDWKGNPQLRQMALHEFAADHPAVMLRQLAENKPSGEDLSSLMARADPADPAQAESVDAYLRDPSVPVDHKARFLSLYPLRSLTTGYRLYRGTPAPYDQETVRRSDLAAVNQVERWLEDPALQSLQDGLRQLRQQLEEWTNAEE